MHGTLLNISLSTQYMMRDTKRQCSSSYSIISLCAAPKIVFRNRFPSSASCMCVLLLICEENDEVF